MFEISGASNAINVGERNAIASREKLKQLGIPLIAEDMKDRGRLDGNTAVVTVMSNLGFMKYMQSIGIDTARTAVGDRYVLEEMRARGYAIGGEQSGHVIFLHHSTTGDGELTAGKLLKLRDRDDLRRSLRNGGLRHPRRGEGDGESAEGENGRPFAKRSDMI